MLATNLSFPQIAEQTSLSRHIVNAEAISIYRKLGAFWLIHVPCCRLASFHLMRKDLYPLDE